jgi:hypothetical protein
LKWTPLLDELLAWERLREHPAPGRDVVRRDGPAPPAGGDLERQRLAAAGDPEPHASCPVTAHPAPFTSKVGCISIVLYCTHSERNALVVLILVEWLLCWKEISTST